MDWKEHEIAKFHELYYIYIFIYQYIIYVNILDPKTSLDMDTPDRCHHANVVQLGRKATLGFEDCWDLSLLPICQWYSNLNPIEFFWSAMISNKVS